MADLTSTLTITGVVNGKKILFTHEFVDEDVYDAGMHVQEGSGQRLLTDGSGAGAIAFMQNSPAYLLATNKDTYGVSKLVMGIGVNINLPPGGLICTTATQGLALSSSTDTDFVLDDLNTLTPDTVPGLPHGRAAIMVTFNNVT